MEKKKKYKHDYGIKNIFQFYNKNYTNTVDYKTFTNVLKLFNQSMINEMYKGAYITFPYSLGDLFIYKYKQKFKFDENGEIDINKRFKMIDYKATKELWEQYPELEHKQRVYYDNFHTDGFRVAISWKRYHTIRSHKLYNFIPARGFSRGLAAYFKSNPNQDYYGK